MDGFNNDNYMQNDSTSNMPPASDFTIHNPTPGQDTQHAQVAYGSQTYNQPAPYQYGGPLHSSDPASRQLPAPTAATLPHGSADEIDFEEFLDPALRSSSRSQLPRAPSSHRHPQPPGFQQARFGQAQPTWALHAQGVQNQLQRYLRGAEHSRELRLRVDGVLRTVHGTREAVEELHKAIEHDNLVIDDGLVENEYAAFGESLKWHLMKDFLPNFALTGPNNLTLVIPDVERLNEQECLALGITEEYFMLEPENSIQQLGSPPFEFGLLNLDNVLRLLRIAGKYHDHDSPDGPRDWALGVLTKNEEGFRAQLFSARPGRAPTHVFWLYRASLPDFGMMMPREMLSGFTLHPDAPLPETEAFRPPEYEGLQQNSEVDAPFPALQQNPATSQQVNPTPAASQQTAATRKISKRTGKAAREVKRSVGKMHYRLQIPAQFVGLEIEELLDGRVPYEELSGELLIQIAQKRSNKDIANAINMWHTVNNVPSHLNGNCIWQFIKRSIAKKNNLGTYKQTADYQQRLKPYLTAWGKTRETNSTCGSTITKKKKKGNSDEAGARDEENHGEGANSGMEENPEYEEDSRPDTPVRPTPRNSKRKLADTNLDDEYSDAEAGPSARKSQRTLRGRVPIDYAMAESNDPMSDSEMDNDWYSDAEAD